MENSIRGKIKFNKTTLQFYGAALMSFLFVIMFTSKILDAYYYDGIYSSEISIYIGAILLIGAYLTISMLTFSQDNHFYTFTDDKIIIESPIRKNTRLFDYDKIKYIAILNNHTAIKIQIDYMVKDKIKKHIYTSRNLSDEDVIQFEANCQSQKINYHYNPNYFG